MIKVWGNVPFTIMSAADQVLVPESKHSRFQDRKKKTASSLNVMFSTTFLRN